LVPVGAKQILDYAQKRRSTLISQTPSSKNHQIVKQSSIYIQDEEVKEFTLHPQMMSEESPAKPAFSGQEPRN
jgi:hypothetical protein